MPLGENMQGTSEMMDLIFSVATNLINSQPRVVDFGVIQSDWSLKCNSYPLPIPKESYLICRSVSLPTEEILDTWDETSEVKIGHTHLTNPEDKMFEQYMAEVPIADVLTYKRAHSQHKPHFHSYNVARPSEKHLLPGNHVLVAWVANDPVVVDVLLSVDTCFRRYGGEARW